MFKIAERPKRNDQKDHWRQGTQLDIQKSKLRCRDDEEQRNEQNDHQRNKSDGGGTSVGKGHDGSDTEDGAMPQWDKSPNG